MTINEKLVAVKKRYDDALYNYMRVSQSEENEREFLEVSKELTKTIDEKETELFGKMKVDIITAAGRMNNQAEQKDLCRNQVNYGILTTCAQILRFMGHEVETPCYGDGDYLKVKKITIDGQEFKFHNG